MAKTILSRHDNNVMNNKTLDKNKRAKDRMKRNTRNKLMSFQKKILTRKKKQLKKRLLRKRMWFKKK